MSAKPATVATWNGTIITPSGAKQTAGFVPGEKPPAQYLNWLFNLAGQWQQYLNDGAFSGASSFNSTLGVTGLLTASGGVIAATGQNIKVQGTGRFKHDTLTVTYGIHAFALVAGALVSLSSDSFQGSGASFEIRCSLPFIVGKRITAVRVYAADNATGPTKLAAALLSRTASLGTLIANGIWNTTSTTNSAGTGANQICTITTTTTVAAATAYNLKVQTVAGSAQVEAQLIEVDYDDL